MKLPITLDRQTLTSTLIGLMQGVLLLLMHRLLDAHVWPATSMSIVVSWYAVAIAVPLAMQLMVADLDKPLALRFAVWLKVILIALSVYTVRTSLSFDGGSGSFETAAYFVTTVALAWFVALPFVQSRLASGGPGFPYPLLFEFSWNNMITLHVAAVFTMLFWGLLAMWGALFTVIGIRFFAELFIKQEFIYLVTASVFGFGLSFGRAHGGLVANLRSTVLLVFRNLLPLASFIAVLFLGALPFTGLKPLWDTGHATMLMLNMQIYIILFLNAVYQDGSGTQPTNRLIRELVTGAVMLLPVSAALCVYAMGLRIQQHGWSVDRVFAALIVFVTGLYGAGYAIAAFKRQTPWMKGISPVNVRVAALVIALAVGVNTPVLDPRIITVRSQVHRLLRGGVEPDRFDYKYFRFELGRAGIRALERLAALKNHPQAERINVLAQQALAQKSRWGLEAAPTQTSQQITDKLKLFPESETLDPAFPEMLLSRKKEFRNLLSTRQPLQVLAVDLNSDSQKEYLLFAPNNLLVFSRTDGGWKKIGRLLSYGGWLNDSEREAFFRQGRYKAGVSRWKKLQIGNLDYLVYEEPDAS